MEEKDLRDLQGQFEIKKKSSQRLVSHQLTCLPITSFIYRRLDQNPPRNRSEVDGFVEPLVWNGFSQKALKVLNQFLMPGSHDHTRCLKSIITSCYWRKEFDTAIKIIALVPKDSRWEPIEGLISQMIRDNLLNQAESAISLFPPETHPNILKRNMLEIAVAFVKNNEPERAHFLLEDRSMDDNAKIALLVELTFFFLNKNDSEETLPFVKSYVSKINKKSDFYQKLLENLSHKEIFHRDFFIEIANEFAQSITGGSDDFLKEVLPSSVILSARHLKEAIPLLLEILGFNPDDVLPILAQAHLAKWMQGYIGRLQAIDLMELVQDEHGKQKGIFSLVPLLLEKNGSGDQFLYIAKEIAQESLVDTDHRAYQSEALFRIFSYIWESDKNQALDIAEKINAKTEQDCIIDFICRAPSSSTEQQQLMRNALQLLPDDASYLSRLAMVRTL